MPVDFTRQPPPEQWDRFVRLLRSFAPRMPAVAATARQRSLARAGTAANMISAAGDGLGANIHPAIGGVVAVATADDPAKAANGLLDVGIGAAAAQILGGEAGPLVGGFLMLARGMQQSLERSDQMVAYLLGIGGFTNTLSRCVVGAMREARHDVRMPVPRIPAYVERTGDLYSATRRGWYEAGYDLVARLLRQIDAEPVASGDRHSKRCMIHIGIQTNQTAQFAEGNWRLRHQVEGIILRDLLGVDLDRQREQLRRWANSP